METLPLMASPLGRDSVSQVKLWVAAQAGDDDALTGLLLPHAQTLRYVCHGMLRNAEDTEDAVQETYFRAIKGFASFRGDSQLKTWLVRIAVRVCAERIRSRKEELPLEMAMHASTPSPETSAVRRALLDEALSLLPPARRVAVLLLADGWSQREIGIAQGWTVARVKVELYRARRTLDAWAERQNWQGEDME